MTTLMSYSAGRKEQFVVRPLTSIKILKGKTCRAAPGASNQIRSPHESYCRQANRIEDAIQCASPSRQSNPMIAVSSLWSVVSLISFVRPFNRQWSVVGLSLGALLYALCFSAQAQPGNELRIAVVGAPEEPRFAEVVAGLKKGLSELGYAPPLLVVHETKIPRAEEKTAKSVVQGLLRQKAQIFFLIGSRLLKPVREASREVAGCFHHARRSGGRWPGCKLVPPGEQHRRYDIRISGTFRQTSRNPKRDGASGPARSRAL
jgi:hypothetical protein